MVATMQWQWQGDHSGNHSRPRPRVLPGSGLQRHQSDWQWLIWGHVPGMAGRRQGTGGHQEVSPGQEVQELRAADYA